MVNKFKKNYKKQIKKILIKNASYNDKLNQIAK